MKYAALKSANSAAFCKKAFLEVWKKICSNSTLLNKKKKYLVLWSISFPHSWKKIQFKHHFTSGELVKQDPLIILLQAETYLKLGSRRYSYQYWSLKFCKFTWKTSKWTCFISQSWWPVIVSWLLMTSFTQRI